MDNLLFNPPLLKKQPSLILADKDWPLSFHPQDFFLDGEKLLAFSGDRIKIFTSKASAEYQIKGLRSDAQGRVSSLADSFIFYNHQGSQALMHLGQIYDITDRGKKTTGVALISDEIYRFYDHSGSLGVERASLGEDGGHYPFWDDQELTRARYSHLSLEPGGLLLSRPARSPLPGSHLLLLDKISGEIVGEVYIPEHFGQSVHAVYQDKFYLVHSRELRIFSFLDGQEQKRIPLSDYYVRRIAVSGERIILFDHNNFLHFLREDEGERDRLKMPGNLYGLAILDDLILMVDRSEKKIISFRFS